MVAAAQPTARERSHPLEPLVCAAASSLVEIKDRHPTPFCPLSLLILVSKCPLIVSRADPHVLQPRPVHGVVHGCVCVCVARAASMRQRRRASRPVRTRVVKTAQYVGPQSAKTVRKISAQMQRTRVQAMAMAMAASTRSTRMNTSSADRQHHTQREVNRLLHLETPPHASSRSAQQAPRYEQHKHRDHGQRSMRSTAASSARTRTRSGRYARICRLLTASSTDESATRGERHAAVSTASESHHPARFARAKARPDSQRKH